MPPTPNMQPARAPGPAPARSNHLDPIWRKFSFSQAYPHFVAAVTDAFGQIKIEFVTLHQGVDAEGVDRAWRAPAHHDSECIGIRDLAHRHLHRSALDPVARHQI